MTKKREAKEARQKLAAKAPGTEVLPDLEAAEAATPGGLRGAWANVLTALRRGRDVRTKEER